LLAFARNNGVERKRICAENACSAVSRVAASQPDGHSSQRFRAARFSSHILGPFVLWMARREERRLAAGKTYEPPTFVERTNWAST
jgi:hypothetical protein